MRPVAAIALGFPGARGLAEIADLDQEFAVGFADTFARKSGRRDPSSLSD